MQRKNFYVLLTLFLFIPFTNAKADETASIKAQIAHHFKNGKGVVVLFMTPKESKKLATQESDDEGNELYADWEYYLNEFLSKKAKKVEVVQITLKQGRKLLGSQKIPDSEYSTLFLKKGKKALYAKDALLGPTEYRYVEAYLEGKENDIKYSQLSGVEPGTIKEIDSKDIPHELGFEYIDLPIK